MFQLSDQTVQLYWSFKYFNNLNFPFLAHSNIILFELSNQTWLNYIPKNSDFGWRSWRAESATDRSSFKKWIWRRIQFIQIFKNINQFFSWKFSRENISFESVNLFSLHLWVSLGPEWWPKRIANKKLDKNYQE